MTCKCVFLFKRVHEDVEVTRHSAASQTSCPIGLMAMAVGTDGPSIMVPGQSGWFLSVRRETET